MKLRQLRLLLLVIFVATAGVTRAVTLDSRAASWPAHTLSSTFQGDLSLAITGKVSPFASNPVIDAVPQRRFAAIHPPRLSSVNPAWSVLLSCVSVVALVFLHRARLRKNGL